MSTPIELDEKRRTALERVARSRKIPMRRLLERAVDEFIERAEDEELLASSARVARQTGLREKDAVEIVREWRRRAAQGSLSPTTAICSTSAMKINVS